MWIAKIISNKLLSFLFPINCFSCKAEQIVLRDNCIKQFTRSVDSPFIWVHTHYSFKNEEIKKIIYAIKYYHRKDLIQPLISSILTKKLKEEISLYKNPLIIPIPMSNLRKYLRGYNHSDLIATEFSRQLNIPYEKNILFKSHSTTQQAKIKLRNERIQNPKKSFYVKKDNRFLNKHIILIDDVTTTGSTLLEAYNTLQKSGFKNISAICIAH